MTIALADEELEVVRRRGFGVAYRMLGTVTDAEDVAQEALLRLTRAEGTIEEPAAWITTVATRLAIDSLRHARAARETYVGPWLPEPLIGDAAAGAEAQVELADSLSQAFLVMLERLTPVERAAFLLRDVFDYDYARIGEIIDRGESNTRQIVTRARKHIDAGRPRFDPDTATRDRLFERFVAAAQEGDVEGLERMLAEDAVFYSDGGGKVSAARLPLHGAARIARVMTKLIGKEESWGPFDTEYTPVNGQPGRILRTAEGSIWSVFSIDVVEGRIQAIRVIRNPDKLANVPAPH
jgi:RNA polymerase sigma-70 factor (ECF subfamily)